MAGLPKGPLTPSALIPAHYGGGVGRWKIEERGGERGRKKGGRRKGGRRWGGEGERGREKRRDEKGRLGSRE